MRRIYHIELEEFYSEKEIFTAVFFYIIVVYNKSTGDTNKPNERLKMNKLGLHDISMLNNILNKLTTSFNIEWKLKQNIEISQ